MIWPFETLMPMKYGAILADPPWAYSMRSENGYAKSPEAHYCTMPIDDIKALPVNELAGPDCLLFLWSTWPHLKFALEVMDVWGFKYITGGSWIKRTKNWKLGFGTGFVMRSSCAPYLIGKIGHPELKSKSERNAFIWEDIPDKIESYRREHSRKPPEMRDMIDRLLPHAYKAELFAREAWGDNDIWGNEAAKFDYKDGV